MSYWLLVLVLANGQHLNGYAYGSKSLCDRAAHGVRHICKPIYYAEDR